MCGRATLTTPGDELREQLGLEVVPTLVPRFNIAPSQPIAIIREPGVLSFATFGIASLGGRPGRTLNVRAESLPNLAAYRDALTTRRCLVVVDGFFEWKPVGSGAKATGEPAHAGARAKAAPAKQAFLLRRGDGRAMTLAGLFWPKADSSGEPAVECAIVTGAATGAVSELHDRMPVIVAPEARDAWLGVGLPVGSAAASAARVLNPDILRALSKPAVASGARDLVAIPIGPRVNSPKNDDEDVLRPVRA